MALCFGVFDRYGSLVKDFHTYHFAHNYCISMGRPDWEIKEYESTDKQRNAVRYVENILNVNFNGNINSKYDCHIFLDKHLEKVKQQEYDNSREQEIEIIALIGYCEVEY